MHQWAMEYICTTVRHTKTKRNFHIQIIIINTSIITVVIIVDVLNHIYDRNTRTKYG